MKKSPLLASTLIAASFALSVPALADDLTWTNGTGNSTWDTSSANWNGSTFTNNDNVTFNGSGTGTITISGAISAGTMTVSSGNYTFSSDSTSNTLTVNNVSVTGSDTITFTGGGEFTITGDYSVLSDWGETSGASLVVGENTTVTIKNYEANWHQGNTTLGNGAVLNVTTQMWFHTADTEVLTGGTFNIQQLTLSNHATVSVHDAVLNIGYGDDYYGNNGLKNDSDGCFKFGDNLTVGVYAGTSGTNTGWSTSAEIQFTGTDNTGTTFYTNAGETIELGGKISGVGFTNTGEGTLILSGTVALSDAIINSGNITISDGATLVLDNLEAIYSGGTGYYEIIEGNGGSVSYNAGNITFTYNDSELSGWNIATDSSGNVWVYGEVGLLTWNGTEGSNNWNTTDANWSIDGTSSSFNNNDNVTFGSSAENKTVSITESVAPGSITVSDDYTFTTSVSGGVTVDAHGDITIASGKTLTIDSGVTLYIDEVEENFSVDGKIEGTGTIEFDFTGSSNSDYGSTINLGTDNAFAGTVYIHSGYFDLTGSNIGNGTYEVANGVNFQADGNTTTNVSNNIVFDGTSQLHVNSGGTLNISGSVTGEGTLDKRGAGTLVLAGGADLNTVSMFGGTLKFDGEGKTYNITTIVKGQDNGAVTLEVSSGTTVNAGALTGDWHIGTIQVDGILNVSGVAEFGSGSGNTETFTGTGTVTVGEFRVGHGSNTSNGATVAIDGGLTFIANSVTTGVITNNSHIQLGNATFGTSNASGLTFATTVTEVTLTATGDDKTTFNTNVYDVSSNSFTTTGTTITIGVSVVGGGDIAVTGNGTLALSGTSTLGSVTVDSGATLDLSSGTVTVASTISNSGTVVVNSSTVFVLDNLTADASGTYTIIDGGTITGWENLTKDNFSISGSEITSVTVTTAGQVTVSFDVVNLIWNGGTGTWDTSTANWTKDGATVAFTNGDNVTFDGSGSSTVTVQDAGVTANSVTVSGGTYSFAGSNTGSEANKDNSIIRVNGTFTIASGAEVDLDGAVVYGDFVVNGTLKLDIAAGGDGQWNTGQYGEIHGTITINDGGWVELDAGDATGYSEGGGVTAITINSGGTLYVGTTSNQTLGGCELVLVGGTIDGVSGSNIDLYLSSKITVLAESGADASNPTVSTVKGAMLTPRKSNSGGTTEVFVDEYAVLDVQSGFWSGPNSGSSYNGSIEKTGAGTLEVSGIFAINTGSLIIDAGTVILSGTAGYSDLSYGFASSVSIATGANLEICFKEDASISNVSGAGDFTKSGSTTLTIEGYTVSGTTTVSEGTLVLTGSTEVIDVHVTSGATLDLTEASKAAANGNGSLYIDGGTVIVSNMAWGSGSNFGANMNNCYLQISNGGVLEVTEAQSATGSGYRGFAIMEGEGTYRYSGEGTSYIAENSASDSGPQKLHIADGATLILDVVNSDATLEVSKLIANSYNGADPTTTTGSLVKIGAGTVILSNESNLYSGGTTIKEGVLVAASSGALGSGTVSIEGGAQLSIGSSVTITNAISVTLSESNIYTVNPTSVVTTYAADSDVYAIIGDGGTVDATVTIFLDEVIQSLLADAGEDGISFCLVDLSGVNEGSSFAISLDEALQDAYNFTYDDGILWIAAAPEPSMFGIFAGLGTLGLVATRRRRRAA